MAPVTNSANPAFDALVPFLPGGWLVDGVGVCVAGAGAVGAVGAFCCPHVAAVAKLSRVNRASFDVRFMVFSG